MKNNFIPSLTPLRGIAALLVILFHSGLIIAPLTSPGQTSLFSKLYLMVDFFFVLSGFIMYHVYGKYFREHITAASFKKYITARFARIYPLHFFMLLWVIGLYILGRVNNLPEDPVVAKILDPKAIPANLVLTHAVFGFDEATWNTPSWSISVEWWAYMLFPFMIKYLFTKNKNTKWLLLLLVVAGNLSIMFYFQPELLNKRMEYLSANPNLHPVYNTLDVITGPAMIRCLTSFITGMLTYELFKSGWSKKYFSNGYLFAFIWCACFALWHFNVMPDIYAPFLFAAIILIAANNNGTLKSVLNIRPLQYLGNISYSLYMVHMPIIFTFFIINMINTKQQAGPSVTPLPVAWTIAAVLIILTILLASCTYYFIEKPMRKWLKKKFAGKTVHFTTAPFIQESEVA